MKRITYALTLLFITFSFNNETVEGIDKNVNDFSVIDYSEYYNNRDCEAMQTLAKYKEILEQEKQRIHNSLPDTTLKVNIVPVERNKNSNLKIVQITNSQKRIVVIQYQNK